MISPLVTIAGIYFGVRDLAKKGYGKFSRNLYVGGWLTYFGFSEAITISSIFKSLVISEVILIIGLIFATINIALFFSNSII